MPQFAFKARDGLGRMVKGVQAAEGETHLSRILKEKNLYLILASEKAEKKERSNPFGRQKIKRRDLIEFSSHLATILSAGIPIIRGLEDLVRQRRGTRFGEILQMVRDDLEGGSLLHEALGRHPQAFGQTYVQMIKAGEAAGNVDKIFRELGRFLEWQDEITSTIKKVTIYPVVVLTAISILVIFVFAFAFPKITAILLQMKIPLPFSTRALIALSKWFSSYWYLVGLGLAGGITALRLIPQTPGGRLMLDRVKLNLPLLGGLIKKICLSRFAHHLGLLLEGGIGMVESLEAVEMVVGNLVISQAIREAREMVKGGLTLTEALEKSWDFPPMVLRMISIGESTATMPEALGKVSQYYDQEVPATVKKIFSAAEPAIILFLAAAVLVIALSIYLPIYKSIGMIGK